MFKVPRKTSVWKTEPHSGNYCMFFAPELVKFIKDKRKYRTYRFGNKYDYLNVGDRIVIKENDKDEVVATAEITRKLRMAFKDLPARSNIAHESYKDKEHQRQVFNGYYAFLGRPIADEDEFLIIDFKLVDI